MAVTILIAHTGEHLHYEENNDLGECGNFIERKCKIPKNQQVLISGKAQPVKKLELGQETKLYLYDRRILSSSEKAPPSYDQKEDISILEHSLARDEPAELSTSASLPTLESLLESRVAWADAALVRTLEVIKQIEEIQNRIQVVSQSARIAVEHVKHHITHLRPRYFEIATWAKEVSRNQLELTDQAQSSWDRLALLPCHLAFVQRLKIPLLGAKHASSAEGLQNLQGLIPISIAQRAWSDSKHASEEFAIQISEVDESHQRLVSEAKELVSEIEAYVRRLKIDHLEQSNEAVDEIQTLCLKFQSDLQLVHSSPPSEESRQRASKLNYLHNIHLLPTVRQALLDVETICHQSRRSLDHVRAVSTRYLQQISIVESNISRFHNRLAALSIVEKTAETFAVLTLINGLPIVYGLNMVEYIRRHKWQHDIREAALPITDLSVLQDVEAQRRQEFDQNFVDLAHLDSQIDLNLGREESIITYSELEQYINALRASPGNESIVGELEVATERLSVENDGNAKESATFDKRSVPQTHVVQSRSFDHPQISTKAVDHSLPRGTHVRLEEKLKSANSRIRKLEDLLHRQMQAARSSNADERTAPHEGPNMFERRVALPVRDQSSTLTRIRMSNNSPPISALSEDRKNKSIHGDSQLLHRVVELQEQLAEKIRRNEELEQSAIERRTLAEGLENEARDAVAIKGDLLSNMEDQRHEFENERRMLREENRELRAQQEDLETELDHAHERQILEESEAIVALRHEMQQKEKLMQDMLAENRRIQSQLESELKTREAAIDIAQQKVANRDRQLDEMKEQFRDARAILHGGIRDLRSSAAFDNDLVKTAAFYRKLSQDLVSGQRDEVNAQEAQISHERQEAVEKLTASDQTIAELTTYLAATKQELEALKKSAEIREIDMTSLQAQMESLQEERVVLQSELDHSIGVRGSNEMKEIMSGDSGTRSAHDQRIPPDEEDSSRFQQKLSSHIASTYHLLDQIGLTSSFSKGTMAISRVQRDKDLRRRKSSSTDLELDESCDPSSPREPGKSDKTTCTSQSHSVERIEAFDSTIFNEAIIRRIREVEHIARKYQRDARAHRSKCQKWQYETSQRIALQNFKPGDLALFLPTRDQASKAWAAFNVGAPHYFLHEEANFDLARRDWMIGRISKVEERVVSVMSSSPTDPTDRSSTTAGPSELRSSLDIKSNEERGEGYDKEKWIHNPYGLSQGLRWYLVEAVEECRPSTQPDAPRDKHLRISSKENNDTLAEDKDASLSRSLDKCNEGLRRDGMQDKGENAPSTKEVADTAQRHIRDDHMEDVKPKLDEQAALFNSPATTHTERPEIAETDKDLRSNGPSSTEPVPGLLSASIKALRREDHAATGSRDTEDGGSQARDMKMAARRRASMTSKSSPSSSPARSNTSIGSERFVSLTHQLHGFGATKDQPGTETRATPKAYKGPATTSVTACTAVSTSVSPPNTFSKRQSSSRPWLWSKTKTHGKIDEMSDIGRSGNNEIGASAMAVSAQPEREAHISALAQDTERLLSLSPPAGSDQAGKERPKLNSRKSRTWDSLFSMDLHL